MPVSKQDLTDLSSEFETIDEARLERLVARLGDQVPEGVWGDRRDYALTLLIAHTLTLGASSGRGAVKSEKIGDIEVSYETGSGGASSKGSGSGLSSTVWGSMLEKLGRAVVRGPMVT